MRRTVVVLLALLAAGCAELASPLPPPGAPRRAGTWQQFCEQALSVPQASALATARGAAGFELVAMYNGVLCYKRPTPEPARPVVPAAPAATPAPAGTSLVPIVRDPGF